MVATEVMADAVAVCGFAANTPDNKLGSPVIRTLPSVELKVTVFVPGGFTTTLLSIFGRAVPARCVDSAGMAGRSRLTVRLSASNADAWLGIILEIPDGTRRFNPKDGVDDSVRTVDGFGERYGGEASNGTSEGVSTG